MHKLTFLLIVTILFTTAHAQPQRESVYKYRYNITVPISACTSSIVQKSVETDGQAPLVEIEVRDCNNKPVPHAKVLLKKKGASTVRAVTNDKGTAAATLTQGAYTLIITARDSIDFIQPISVSPYQKLHIQVSLQTTPVKQRYIIRSKVWLLQAEVNMVKQCIIDNKGDTSKCGRKLYYVMTRI